MAGKNLYGELLLSGRVQTSVTPLKRVPCMQTALNKSGNMSGLSVDVTRYIYYTTGLLRHRNGDN